MKATLQEQLTLTEQVFKGQVTRVELAPYSTREQVFVATAIMLAVHEQFLESDNTVRGSYSRLLEAIISLGVVNRHIPGTRYKGRSVLLQGAKELYKTVYTDGVRRIVLKPPKELVALLERLGRTNHVLIFLAQAATGAQQDHKWFLEAQMHQTMEQYVQSVIYIMETRFGKAGLDLLRIQLTHH